MCVWVWGCDWTKRGVPRVDRQRGTQRWRRNVAVSINGRASDHDSAPATNRTFHAWCPNGGCPGPRLSSGGGHGSPILRRGDGAQRHGAWPCPNPRKCTAASKACRAGHHPADGRAGVGEPGAAFGRDRTQAEGGAGCGTAGQARPCLGPCSVPRHPAVLAGQSPQAVPAGPSHGCVHGIPMSGWSACRACTAQRTCATMLSSLVESGGGTVSSPTHPRKRQCSRRLGSQVGTKPRGGEPGLVRSVHGPIVRAQRSITTHRFTRALTL